MHRQTADGAPGRRAIIVLLIFILLASSHIIVAQGVTSPLKPVFSEKKQLYGYVDTLTSKLAIKYQYQNAGSFRNGLAIVRKDDYYGIIDIKGEVVYPINNVSITVNTDPDLFIVCQSPGYMSGAIDFSLREVIPFEYSAINPFGNVFVVEKSVKIDGRYTTLFGIYNRKPEMLVPAEMTQRPVEEIKGYITSRRGDRVGLMTTNGEILIPFDKSSIIFYDNGNTLMVKDKMNKWQAYRLDGSPISDLMFDDFKSLAEGFFSIKINDKWGLFRDGLIIPCILDRGDDIDIADGTIIFRKWDRYGVTNSTGREILPFSFEKVSRYGKGLFLVSNGNQSGLFSLTGKEIIPCAFNQIPAQPANGYVILADDHGRYGCITEEGTMLVPFVLDESSVTNNYMASKGYLDKLLEVNPLHPEILYLDALGYWYNSKPEDALAYISQRISKVRDSQEARAGLCYVRSMIHTGMDNYEAAETDAYNASPTIYGSKAFIVMGDRKFSQGDFNMAEKYYSHAGTFVNKEEAETKRLMAIGELKKRGLYKEVKLEIGGLNYPIGVANLPTTILGFTTSDRTESAGNNKIKRLFTYDEAMEDLPPGFRLSTYLDWMKLLNYIVDNRYISQNYEYHAVGYIGEGWKYQTSESAYNQESATGPSRDTYGLGIAPLRSYSNTIELSENDKSYDFITYWIEPATHRGSKVNCVTITSKGFDFNYQTRSKACVRYVMK